MTKKGRAPLSPSQDAMLEHIAYLVLCERREACWRDFLDFEVGGEKYSLKAGTVRNNLSKLRRQGSIEVVYRSIDSYYTLSGYSVQKSGTMIHNHARIYKPDLAALIRRMVFDMPSAHDIHLRFTVYRIWKTLSVLAAAFPEAGSPAADSYNNDKKRLAVNIVTNAAYSATTASHELLAIRAVSKDLVVPVMALESGIQGRITIHKNDTVSVILSCSESPIRFNIGGLVTLTCALARLEERLRSLIDVAQQQQQQQDLYFLPPTTLAANRGQNSAIVPASSSMTPSSVAANALIVQECGTWIVTMWHIGFDSLERYAGEKFEVAWEDFKGEWIRVYSKELMVVGKPDANERKKKKKAKKQCILRIERQEYPNDRLRSAVEQKLSSIAVGMEGIGEKGV